MEIIRIIPYEKQLVEKLEENLQIRKWSLNKIYGGGGTS